MNGFQPYFFYLLSFFCALGLSLFSIPNIIYVAKRKRLLDIPDNHRKLHKRIVPNLGGIGIFFAYMIITSMFIDPAHFTKWNYIAAASLVLFVTGLKDDLVEISPSKKFVAQAIAAFIVVKFANVRLYSLHGIFGLEFLPSWFSITFSVIGIMFVTNAFNLVDGIDGLAGSVGMLISLIFGVSLAAEGQISAAIIAFSLMGAIGGFLRYNIAPARIFMGDTGSLIIGFMVSVLGILFINGYDVREPISKVIPTVTGSGALALTVLFVPVFDTFRVFATRIVKGHSPFRPDRTHLHHYLLDLGLSHSQTVAVVLCANILIIGISLFMQQFNNINLAVGLLVLVSFGLYSLLYLMRGRRLKSIAAAHPTQAFATAGRLGEQDGEERQAAPLTVNGNKIHIDLPKEMLLQDN